MRSFRFVLSKFPTSSATIGSSSIAPKVLPHTEQKARLEPSDERYVEGAPPGPTQDTEAFGNSTQTRVTAPLWR